MREAAILRSALAKVNRRMRAQDEPGGVGSTALSLLGRLVRSGTSTATDLASQERLQPQSLTRILRSLEQRGMIERAVDSADRRRSRIAITQAGCEFLLRSVRNRERWLAHAMLSALSVTERELLRLAATLLERLADADADA